MRILVSLLALALALLPGPAWAQSILRDAETEAFFREISRPLIDAAGLDPRSVQFVLVGDPSINAFVTGGQNVFIHSGLITAADNVNELQGVIAHELGHIAAGHNVRFGEGAGPASKISLLSLVGAALAVAAGAGEAGMAILGLGTAAAQGKFLAFTRDQESRTDQAGAVFLSKAGISGIKSLPPTSTGSRAIPCGSTSNKCSRAMKAAIVSPFSRLAERERGIVDPGFSASCVVTFPLPKMKRDLPPGQLSRLVLSGQISRAEKA